MNYTRQAYAKINLTLDVLGKLPSGYHEVRMVMQSIGLCDTLSFERTTNKAPIRVILQPDCEVQGAAELPLDENNLIYRSAKLMMEKYSITCGMDIRLTKRIPIAAGMAGGSTDAAAVFHAYNEIFAIGASARELMELGVKIGADVPYCILGGTALAEGIGEKLTVLEDAPDCVILVAKPMIFVSTGWVYTQLDRQSNYIHPNTEAMLAAIEAGDVEKMAKNLGNVLESVTVKEYPQIARIKELMLENGAMGSLMSGSGPTVFGIFDSQEEAKAAKKSLEKSGLVQIALVTGLCKGGSRGN